MQSSALETTSSPSYVPVQETQPSVKPAGAMQIYLNDEFTGLQGFIMVDTLVGGKAMGGVRMTPTTTPEGVRALARSMSMKFALGQVPMGGAKGGIVLPPNLDESRREEFLETFGRLVKPLLHGGIYLGTDMGISFLDRKRFMDAAGYEVQATPYGANLPCDWQSFWQTCVDVGGYGVSEATLALLERMGLAGRSMTVALHGFGTMGRGAARFLARAGHRVISVADVHGSISRASGLPVEALISATDDAGTIDRDVRDGSMEVTDTPDTCLESDVDVLVIASMEDMVRADNVDRLRCRAIVEAANHSCTESATRSLAERQIPLAPGILANAGSAMTSGLVVSGSVPKLPLSSLKSWVYAQISQRIRTNMGKIWDRSLSTGQDLPTTAELLALERLARRRSAAVDAVPSVHGLRP